MVSLNRSHAEEMTHRLSVEIFGEEMTYPNPPHSHYQQNSNPSYPYKFRNNVIYHNRRLILIITYKLLPLVPDKVQHHIPQVPNITPIQQLVLDFHRYIQRVRDVTYQHPTQASRNHRSNLKMTR
jgi:hypothetical protein